MKICRHLYKAVSAPILNVAKEKDIKNIDSPHRKRCCLGRNNVSIYRRTGGRKHAAHIVAMPIYGMVRVSDFIILRFL